MIEITKAILEDYLKIILKELFLGSSEAINNGVPEGISGKIPEAMSGGTYGEILKESQVKSLGQDVSLRESREHTLKESRKELKNRKNLYGNP